MKKVITIFAIIAILVILAIILTGCLTARPIFGLGYDRVEQQGRVKIGAELGVGRKSLQWWKDRGAKIVDDLDDD